MKRTIRYGLAAGMLLLVLAGCSERPAVEQKEDWSDYVTLGQYQGIEVEADSGKVTEQDIDDSIQAELWDWTTLEEVDRAAKEGDVVDVDYTGKVDGAEFEGGTMTGESITIGEDDYIPGLDTGLIGHKAGDVFSLQLKVPESYWIPEVAGKEAVYEIKINGIYNRIVPELDAEMVGQLSEESKTVEEYRKEVRVELENDQAELAQSDLIRKVWEQAVANATIERYPEEELASYTEELMAHYQEQAETNDMELEAYFQKFFGTSEEEVRKETEEFAKTDLGERLVARAIAQKEKLYLTEEEYQQKAQEYVQNYEIESVQLLEEEQGKEAVYQMLLWDKVLLWLVDEAVQTGSAEGVG